MVAATPHFLLLCDTRVNHYAQRAESVSPASNFHGGRWHFVLEKIGGSSSGVDRLEAADAELQATVDRLDLLAVVRGLEALEQPSQVTLVTTSRYVVRGIQYGLASWRERNYRWERFGVQKPIRNADLWQRVDVALNYHGLTCRLVQSRSPQPVARFEPLAAEVAQQGVPTPGGDLEPGCHTDQPADVASKTVRSPFIPDICRNTSAAPPSPSFEASQRNRHSRPTAFEIGGGLPSWSRWLLLQWNLMNLRLERWKTRLRMAAAYYGA